VVTYEVDSPLGESRTCRTVRRTRSISHPQEAMARMFLGRLRTVDVDFRTRPLAPFQATGRAGKTRAR